MFEPSEVHVTTGYEIILKITGEEEEGGNEAGRGV
jgi:hypothetical protein